MSRLFVATMLRLFVVTFISGIFFGLNNTFGCNTGSVAPWVGYGISGIGPKPNTCSSITGSGPQRFNNNQVDDSNLQKFYKSYGFPYQKITCGNPPSTAANLVSDLQSNLVSKGCTTCVDGKYGGHTNDMLAQCVPVCNPPKKSVNLQGQICDSGYLHDVNVGCCKVDCTQGEKLEQNAAGGCDDTKFEPKDGCCVPICTGFKKPANTPDCSDLQGYKYENGCCIKICIPPQCGLNPDGTCKTPGYIPDGQGCCDAPAGCKKPATGANLDDCSAYPGHIFSGGCCTPICTNVATSGANGYQCSDGYIVKQVQGIQCCDPVPNQCTGSKAQYGVLSGQSYTCADCGSGKMADETHTKCVCDSSQGCCGIKLNTVVPFIGDCIEMDGGASSNNTTRVNALNAFPKLMGSLSKIMITVILIFSFVMIVIGGILITSGGINESNFKKGKEIIGKVIMGLALLGASGIILHLINPSFFK